MASTYSSALRFELIAVGEQANTWGTTTNVNLGTLIEQAISGYTTVSMASDADRTLTTSNGASDESRPAALKITSAVSLTATRNIVCPTVNKIYSVKNSTTGGQSIVFKTAAGSGITIPNGETSYVLCDGTNVVYGFSGGGMGIPSVTTPYAIGDITYAASTTAFAKLAAVATGNALISGGVSTAPSWGKVTLTSHVSGILPAANGGTGLATLTSNNLLVGNGTSTVNFIAPGASGKVLTSAGATLSMEYSIVAQNAQNGNITLALTDASKHIYSTNSGAQAITVPTNASVAFPIGTAITVVNNGTTAISFTTTSLTVYKAGTSAAWASGGTLAIRGLATLLKVNTDTWFISGSGLS
jgi:hypothetical protein